MKATTIAMLALGCCLLGARNEARADFLTGNLLTNPGAEAGNLTGWTIGGTSNPTVDSGTFDPGINPHTGSFDFRGGTGASGTLSQTVSLVGNQGITAALIDAGTAQAVVQFFEQGLNQGTPSDSGSASVSFLSSTSTVLGTSTTPVIDSHLGLWQVQTSNFAIPVGTRSIAYTMNFIRNQGSDLDAFIDDNSLAVSGPATVPEPSAFVLTGLACGIMGLGYWRRRRNESD